MIIIYYPISIYWTLVTFITKQLSVFYKNTLDRVALIYCTANHAVCTEIQGRNIFSPGKFTGPSSPNMSIDRWINKLVFALFLWIERKWLEGYSWTAPVHISPRLTLIQCKIPSWPDYLPQCWRWMMIVSIIALSDVANQSSLIAAHAQSCKTFHKH